MTFTTKPRFREAYHRVERRPTSLELRSMQPLRIYSNKEYTEYVLSDVINPSLVSFGLPPKTIIYGCLPESICRNCWTRSAAPFRSHGESHVVKSKGCLPIERRDGRVAEGARLESVYTARYPGFESLSLRHTPLQLLNRSTGTPALLHTVSYWHSLVDVGASQAAIPALECGERTKLG